MASSCACSKHANRCSTLRVSLDHHVQLLALSGKGSLRVFSSDLPNPQIDQGCSRLESLRKLASVGIEERDLVVRLIEFRREDYLVPYGQSDVGIQKLVWKRWLCIGAIDGSENPRKPLSNVLMHSASANVQHIAMSRDLVLRGHAARLIRGEYGQSGSGR